MYQLTINTNTENPGKPELDCWEDVDLGTATVALTYQANDLAELKSREVNRSNRIKLPRTARNRRLFGLPSEPLSATLAPYRYFDCRLYDDGVELFGAGAKLQLMDATSSAYEVCLKGGLFDFFESIKNLSIRDLDVDSLKYTPWNTNTVGNPFIDITNSNVSVLFPLIDWDTADDTSLAFSQFRLPGRIDIRVISRYIFPAVKLSALMNAIVEAQNCTLDLPQQVLEDLKYTHAVIPICSLNSSSLPSDISSRVVGLKESNSKGTGVNNDPNGLHRVDDDFLFGSDVVAQSEFRPSSNHYYRYRTGYTGTYTCQLGAVNDDDDERSFSLSIHIQSYTSKGKTIASVFQPVAFSPSNTAPELIEVDVEAGGYVDFRISREYDSNLELCELAIWFKNLQPISATFGTNRFPLLQNLPDITQLDLFKAVCQLFGLMVNIDERSKHIEAYTFNDVVANIAKGDFEDWSNKLDDTDHSTTFKWSSYGQRSYITYAEEEGKNEEKLQDRACFTIDNLTLDAEKNLFELRFATCEEANIYGLTMAKIRMVEGGDTDPDSITESAPKLLYVDKKDLKELLGGNLNDANLIFSTADDNNTVRSDTALIATFSPLKTESFIKDYYSVLASRSLQRTRVLKEKLWLTPIDIQKFTHKRPIYLSKYGCCFYVNKINNYQPNKLTEVELVAILAE